MSVMEPTGGWTVLLFVLDVVAKVGIILVVAGAALVLYALWLRRRR